MRILNFDLFIKAAIALDLGGKDFLKFDKICLRRFFVGQQGWEEPSNMHNCQCPCHKGYA